MAEQNKADGADQKNDQSGEPAKARGLLDDPLIGSVLAERYLIEKLIGSGGWGNVYIGRHLALDTAVAIKTLHLHFARNQECCQRLEQEAKVLSRVDSHYVVKTVDYGLDPLPYFVMEYFDGVPLSDLLSAKGAFSQVDAITLFEQLSEGLKAAHSMGLVHRDLKPSNILVRLDPEPKAKIVDFGIAKVVEAGDDRITRTGEVLGSPPYMAPEQWSGASINHRTDIYALGCVMYELLTATPAFKANQAFEYLNLHLTATPKSFDPALKISESLEKMVRKCLEKRVEDRYASTEAIIEDLQKLKSGRKLKITLRGGKGLTKRQALVCSAIALLLLSTISALVLNKETILGSYCNSINKEADAYATAGKSDRAIASYRQSLSLSQYMDLQARVRLHALQALAALLRAKGSYTEAGQLDSTFNQAAAEPHLFPQIYDKLIAANAAVENGNIPLAVNIGNQAVEQARAVGKHTLVYAACLHNQALYVMTGAKNNKDELRRSLELEQESLKIANDFLEPDDLRLTMRFNNMAKTLRALHRYNEAAQFFQLAALINRKQKRVDTIDNYNNLAAVCLDQQKYNLAAEAYQSAFEVSSQLIGGKDISILNNLACAYLRENKLKEAEKLLKEALQIGLAKGAKDSNIIIHIWANLGETYFEMKNNEQARNCFDKVLELDKSSGPNESKDIAQKRLMQIEKLK